MDRPARPPDGGPPDGRPSPERAPLPERADELPALPADFWSIVDDGLAAGGVELTAGARAAIDRHARLLLAWNAHINLTALRQPTAVAVGHVLDSLSALPAVRRLGGGRGLLDLGSGGGYPGLPLAAALPARRCAVVDSVRKKARFLAVASTAVASALAGAGERPPSMAVLAERAEDLADDAEHRSSWQCVVARAVGSVAEVSELALPLLEVGGHLVAWKRDAGGGLRREIDDARGILRAAGGRALDVLPAAGMHPDLAGHALLVVAKVRSTPDRFPRPVAERRRALLP